MVPCTVGYRDYTNESQYIAAVAATLPGHLTRPFRVNHKKKYTGGDQTSESSGGGSDADRGSGGGGDGGSGGGGGYHWTGGPATERVGWRRSSHFIDDIIAEALTSDKTAIKTTTTTQTAHQLSQSTTTTAPSSEPISSTPIVTTTVTTTTPDSSARQPTSNLQQAKQSFQEATTSNGDNTTTTTTTNSTSRRGSIQDEAQSRLPVKKRHLYLSSVSPVGQVSCVNSVTMPVAHLKQEPIPERHQPPTVDDADPTTAINAGLDGHDRGQHLVGGSANEMEQTTFWRRHRPWQRNEAQQQHHPTAPSIILPASLQYIPFGLYVVAAAAAAAATGISYSEHQEALQTANSLGGLSGTNHTNNYNYNRSHNQHHHHTPVPQSTAVSSTSEEIETKPASNDCKTTSISANTNITTFTAASTIASTNVSRPFREDPNQDYIYIPGRGRGKWVCMKCGIRCKKPSMLKKHFRTHTNVRPFFCRQCGCAFKTRGNLTKHMKSKSHFKRCQDLGIFNVPTKIDNRSQIDTIALAIQKNIEL